MKKGFSNNPCLILSVNLYLFDKKGFEKINCVPLVWILFLKKTREILKFSIILLIKGTVSVISSDLKCEDGNVRFTKYP